MRATAAAAVAAVALLLAAAPVAGKPSAKPPPPTRLASHQELQEFHNKAEVAVVGFLPERDAAALQAFTRTAAACANKSGLEFAYTTDRYLLDPACATDCDSPFAVLSARGDGPAARPAVYSGRFTPVLLARWARSHATPLVARYTEEPAGAARFRRAWEVPLPQLLVVVDSPEDLTPEVEAEVANAARANDDIKFFVATKAEGEALLQEVGVPLHTPAPFFLVQVNGSSHLRAAQRLHQHPEFIFEYKEGALEAADEEELRRAGAGGGGGGREEL